MVRLLHKGQKLNLAKNNSKVQKISVDFTWQIPNDVEIDVMTFLLNKKGDASGEENVILNGDTKRVRINLEQLASDVDRVAITAIINEAEKRQQNFGQIRNICVGVTDEGSNTELFEFKLDDLFSAETAIIVGEIYRHKGDWKFNAVGAGFNDGLPALCKNFGVNASDLKNLRASAKSSSNAPQKQPKTSANKKEHSAQSQVSSSELIDSVEYTRELAEKGSEDHMNELAEMYYEGKGVEKNIDEAIKWYKKLAELPLVDNPKTPWRNFTVKTASFYLGNIYSENDNLQEAAIWYEKYLRSVDPKVTVPPIAADACRELYDVYLWEWDNDKLEEQYPRWQFLLERCQMVEQHLDSKKVGMVQNVLGDIYSGGYGTAKDMPKAVSYYSKAVKNGNPYALAKLGEAYRTGNGVEQDDGMAYVYYLESSRISPLLSIEGMSVLEQYNESENPEIMAHKFYDYDDECYKVPLGTQVLSFAPAYKHIIEINHAFAKSLSAAIGKLEDFYNEHNDIDEVMTKIYDYGVNVLIEIGKVGVKFFEQIQKYDVSAKQLVTADSFSLKSLRNFSITSYNVRECPLEIWQSYFDRVNGAYQDIVYSAQSERDYRRQRKENRGRFVGGGFGIDGALKGMIQAGALNAITGAAHSVFNAIGNWATDQAEINSKEALYKDRRVINTFISGLAEATNAIKMRVFAILDYGSFKEMQEKSRTILENVTSGSLTDTGSIEIALIKALLEDPFNLEIYRTWLEHFGDENKELQDTAVFFCVAEDVRYIKDEIIRKNICDNHTLKTRCLKRFIYVDGKEPEEAFFEYGMADLDSLTENVDALQVEINRFGLRPNQYSRSWEIVNVLKALQKAVKTLKQEQSSPQKISPFAYLNNRMESFTVPEGVTEIGDYAFLGCHNLKSVSLPSTLKRIGVGAFCNCENLNGFDLQLPNGLLEIGDYAFKNCDCVRNIELPNSVKTASVLLTNYRSVYGAVVEGIPCKHIWLPSSIHTLTGESSFVDRKVLFSLDIEAETYVSEHFKTRGLRGNLELVTREIFLDTLEKERGTRDVTKRFWNLYSGHYMWQNDEYRGILDKEVFSNTNVDSFSLMHGMRVIGTRAFANSKAAEIDIGGSYSVVRVICDEAFLNCRNLKEFSVPAGTEKIGSRLFHGCENLKKVIIPETVKEIGSDIFDRDASVIVHCSKDSEAYRYCQEHNIETQVEEIPHADDKKAQPAIQAEEKVNDVPQVPKEAADVSDIEILQELADLDDAESLMTLGRMYLDGDGVEVDFAKAREYFERASFNCNDPEAWEDLASFYQNGYGVEINLNTAKEYYRKAIAIWKKNNEEHLNFTARIGLSYCINTSLYWKYGDTINDLYFNTTSEKNQQKIGKAIAAYASNVNNNGEYVILCVDDTVFGAADDGCLVTDQNIYAHNKDGAGVQVMPWAEVVNIYVDEGFFNDSVKINGVSHITKIDVNSFDRKTTYIFLNILQEIWKELFARND